MNNSFFESFTNQFQLSKTLRFELIPQGKTLENIEAKGLLVQDQNRANSYQEMKKTIDEYHKWFIELALKNVSLANLDSYVTLYQTPKEQRDDTEFTKVKADLRKEIVKQFGEGESKNLYKNLFAKELIKDDLQVWINKYKPDAYFDESFKNFTTYFTGFNENRKNMYSAEEQGTAIAYRIVHENLPKFLDNVNLYEKLVKLEGLGETLRGIETLVELNKLDEIFNKGYFNKVLSQNGIDFFNNIIGGYSLENGNKIKGLNEYINLYNQQQTDKKQRVPKFKQLYKQILSDRSSVSFLPDAFEDDIQLMDSVNNFYKSCLVDFEKEENPVNVITAIKELMEQVSSFDLDKIYLRNDTGLTTISQKMFGDYGLLKAAISHYYDTYIDAEFQTKLNKKGITEKKTDELLKQKAKWKNDYISIQLLQDCLDEYIAYQKTLQGSESLAELASLSKIKIADYFNANFSFEITKDEKTKHYNFVSHIQEQYKGIEGMLNIGKEEKFALKQDTERVHQLKTFLDSIQSLLHFVKPLNCKDESITEKDAKFYEAFDSLFKQLELLTPLYNKVRNYVTQKPYETSKVKLNFENAQLLNGWDQNKEADNTSVLLRKDGLYYLAIMNKKNNKVFEKAPKSIIGDVSFEKVSYKLLPGANKMLPKVFFSNTNIDFFNPSEEILRIRNTATHSKNGEPQKGFEKADFNLKDCHTLIDFFKDSLAIHKDWKHFGFQFSVTSTYQDISGFYREVENQGYKITFDNIPTSYINEKVEQGELFLFQIYNKDFSPFSKGTPNMHTLYWKMLFDEQNLKDVVYKLNGQAEVFFRKSSIQPKNIITHPKNQPIDAKNPLKPNKNTFAYDLIKDRRYTVDKFQFHVPITMNFKANGTDRVNEKVNTFLQNNPDVNIIGLDRGERHLIYLTLVNQKGEIIKQESLNNIKDEKHNITTPYHTLLDNKEKERAEARQEWGTIEGIKTLKEGYISQVVHKIATMMLEHNAIVVMEDLNFGFKRGRFHVEKQVYQKLEKMLIDKLNYLVIKSADKNETGGVMNALQLTSKFESFQKMGKQTGFMYYVPAWNTSKIDPATGFVDFLKPKYESVNKAQDFIANFNAICFNKNKEQFEFSFDYNKFHNKAEGTQTLWTLCVNNHTRYWYNRTLNLNKGGQEAIKVCQALELLFADNNITYGNGADIRDQIMAQSSADFFKRLLKYMSVTLSLRHNNGLKGDAEQDFILSPVANDKGVFFNSLIAPATEPQDADANGAYHIALKGLWVLQQLSQTVDLSKPKLAISNNEWLNFVQKREFIK